ncbi:hypothetical protein [Candidatus Nitrospira allomarina]|uniref:Uncharacterized protein n=1 Tax=Candidatus Nitrospira allomarina TaxID=3020900 RepID=A0AA96GJG7_9BACT|nr:hypothetical protein [Candidatus Nitrospira allomarina]WNM59539.1 hypothetical protein PP769_07220 [Candidatus Nitrospira allomarina]
MKIGTRAPMWKTPCLLNGRWEYLPLTAFQGTQFVLCSLPACTENDAWLLEQQLNRFHAEKVMLAALVPNNAFLGNSWCRPPQTFGLPFLTDPINRLGRILHLAASLPPHRCETLFFDHRCCLQFRLFHDLNLRGITTVLEVAESEFCRRSAQADPKSRLNSDHLLQHCSSFEAPTG